MAGGIKKIPCVRGAIDQGEVKAPGKVIQGRFGLGKRIRHHRLTAPELDAGRQPAGGGIVAVPEGGGQDEDRGSAHISPSRSNSSKRRSSC